MRRINFASTEPLHSAKIGCKVRPKPALTPARVKTGNSPSTWWVSISIHLASYMKARAIIATGITGCAPISLHSRRARFRESQRWLVKIYFAGLLSSFPIPSYARKQRNMPKKSGDAKFFHKAAASEILQNYPRSTSPRKSLRPHRKSPRRQR